MLVTITGDAPTTEDVTIDVSIRPLDIVDGPVDPATDFGVLTVQVTILAGETTGTVDLNPTDDASLEGTEGFQLVIVNSDYTDGATTGNLVVKDPANAGQSFTLTTGVDGAPAFTGGAGDDTYTAVISKDAT